MSVSILVSEEKFIKDLNLSQNDKDFLKRIFNKGVSPYVNRIKQYGFVNKEKILDAGCGFGQWSIAMSQLNDEVYSCDASQERVTFLKELSLKENISNINVQHGFIDRLPFEDNFFDAVFSYGVIFLTPWKKSLAELIRVLKPGGALYVNANGFGWYKHLWYTAHNKTDDYNPQLLAANSWKNTYNYNNGLDVSFPCDLIIEPEQLVKEAEKLGLQDIKWDGEGLLGNPNNKDVFFQKEYLGDVGIYEVIGVKNV